VETEDWPVSQKSYFYLMNETVPIWHKAELEESRPSDDISYYDELRARRFPEIEYADYKIPNAAFDTDDPYVCIECSINYTQNIAGIDNIGNKPACGLPSLDMLFYLCFKLFDKLRFNGSVFIMDEGRKDGKRISFFIMKKYPDDDVHFSKYQDYDFQVQPDNIPTLTKIKHKVVNGKVTEKDLETNIVLMTQLMIGLAQMENRNYRETMHRLSTKLEQDSHTTRRFRREYNKLDILGGNKTRTHKHKRRRTKRRQLGTPKGRYLRSLSPLGEPTI
jgi:hypothetical protein